MVEPAKGRGEGDAPQELSALGPQIPVRGGRNLTQAVVTAVVLALVAGLCYAGGSDYFFWLVVVAVLAAAFELLDAIARSGRRPATALAMGCGFALMYAAYFRPARPELLIVALGAATFGSLLLALRTGRGGTPGSDAAWSMLTVLWIGGGGAAAVAMLTLDGGLNLLVTHLAVTAADDIGAYFLGTRFGKRRLAPSISPSKSWEGFAGGLLLALVAGAVAGALIARLDVTGGILLGAMIGLLAPVGDLAESMAKRELGIKDSGRLLPGHGGFLDRLDAALFCAPAVLFYLLLVID